mmetsp:Transcript_82531/g.267335  ORF Transcript_82531/g.267335 Transcript_82531/m.267335 type:complete len:223 (+) Transcript_82531:719-1387(+)
MSECSRRSARRPDRTDDSNVSTFSRAGAVTTTVPTGRPWGKPTRPATASPITVDLPRPRRPVTEISAPSTGGDAAAPGGPMATTEKMALKARRWSEVQVSLERGSAHGGDSSSSDAPETVARSASSSRRSAQAPCRSSNRRPSAMTNWQRPLPAHSAPTRRPTKARREARARGSPSVRLWSAASVTSGGNTKTSTPPPRMVSAAAHKVSGIIPSGSKTTAPS